MKRSKSFITRYLSAYFVSLALLCSVSASHALPVNTAAPPFSLAVIANADVKQLSLEQFHGRVVYVDFWASWCGPCRKSLPALNKLRNQLPRKDFEVVAINLDDDVDAALGFLAKHPVDYPILYDPKQRTPEQYQVQGMPTAFLLDRRGVVRYVHTGFKAEDAEEIATLVMRLVGEG